MLSKDMKKLLVHMGISFILGVILVLMAYFTPQIEEGVLLSPAKKAGFSIISLIFVLIVIKTVVISFLIINKKTRHFIENSEHRLIRMFK
jgi:hypothetical protein|tara:strand:- start:744 stop:1013 length:270 start_codon:yes stop_codon:yes gene_type:complete